MYLNFRGSLRVLGSSGDVLPWRALVGTERFFLRLNLQFRLLPKRVSFLLLLALYRAGIRRHSGASLGLLDSVGERVQDVDEDQVVVELLNVVGVGVELEGRGDGARGGRLHGVQVASAQLSPDFFCLQLGILLSSWWPAPWRAGGISP